MTRILLVDDTRLFLELERSFLQRTGCETILASSGDEALRKTAVKRPDLIVLDAHMPGLGGIECCRRLRTSPDTAKIPVVFVSAAEDYRECMEAGGDAFVSRPVSRDRLLETIRRFVELPEREHDRASLDVRVRFVCGDRQGAGHTKDLGLGGMFLRTRELLGAGEEVRIDFELPGETPERIRAAGVVVRRVRPDRDSHLIPGVGVRFRSIPARDRMLISRFLRQCREAGP